MLSVFPDRMNQIDPEDPEEALRTIDNYIRYMVDQIEFSLTNSFRTVNGIGTSSAEIALVLASQDKQLNEISGELNRKVDKAEGMGLSSNDYTDEDKEKLAGIEAGGEPNVIETVKQNGTALPVADKAVDVTVPTKVSDLTNDSGFLTQETDPTVPAWAKASSKPSYTAQEVGALPSSTVIPTKVSDLTNDSEYQTAQQVATAIGSGLSSLFEADIYGPAAAVSFEAEHGGLPLKSCTAEINAVQAGSGDPSPTNVRPISGWTGANVTVSGIAGAVQISASQAGSGDPSPTNIRPIMPGLALTRDGGSALDVYGGSLAPVSGTLTVTHGCVTFDGTETWNRQGTNPIFWCILDSLGPPGKNNVGIFSHLPYGYITTSNTNIGARVGLNNGSTRIYLRYDGMPSTTADWRATLAQWYADGTPFQAVYEMAEPVTYQLTPQEVVRALTSLGYTIHSYPMSWQTEAGTVYGGTVDVMTGTLTADRVCKTLAGTDIHARSSSVTAAGDYRFYCKAAVSDGILLPPNAQTAADVLCSVAVAIPHGDSSLYGVSANRADGRIYLHIQDCGQMTLAQFQTWVDSNTVQVAFKLASPATYQLPPQIVTALTGQNNVWADTGNITVEYGAFLLALQAEIEALAEGGE